MVLFAGLIRAARLERKMSTQEVAERAGISRGMLQRIEKADMKCGIGAVFEVAAIVGVKLFDSESTSLNKYILETNAKLSLLPQKARKAVKVIDDDF
jgi:transcriptional regulator with XRE-family HTH domain